MSVRVVQRAQARLDFWSIVEFLATRNAAVAERFIAAVKEFYDFLANWPEAGARLDRDDPDFANVRIWPIKDFRNYLIVYRAAADRVEIIRLVHGSRDLDSLLGNPK